MKFRTLGFGCVLALSGCSTPYQSHGFRGGFDEIALAPNVYKVIFRGNGYTSGDKAENLALLRSAELTLEKHYLYFALADASNSVSTSYSRTPVYSATQATAQVAGNTVYGTAQTTTYGGDIDITNKPKSVNIVVMYEQKPNTPVFDAAFICSSLGQRYKVVCGQH